jgi:hypothetical protein
MVSSVLTLVSAQETSANVARSVCNAALPPLLIYAAKLSK